MTDSQNIPLQALQSAPESTADTRLEGDCNDNERYTAEDLAAMEAEHAALEALHPEWEAGRKECDRIVSEAEPKFQLALDMACRMDGIAERLRRCELALEPCGVGMEVSRLRDALPGVVDEASAKSFEVLSVNACFVIEHTVEFLAIVLLHEAWHLELDHIARQSRYLAGADGHASRQVLHLLFNAASDLEVNSKLAHHFRALGEEHPNCTPGQRMFSDMPLGLTAEEYIEMIVANPSVRAAVLAEFGELTDTTESLPMNDGADSPTLTAQAAPGEVPGDWPEEPDESDEALTAEDCEAIKAGGRDNVPIFKEAESKIALALDQVYRMDKVAERLRQCEIELVPMTDTLSVDPVTLTINPFYVVDHTPEFLALLILHEAWHLELDHCARGPRFLEQSKGRAPTAVLHLLFNAASDLEVNSRLAHLFEACGQEENSVRPGRGAFADFPAGLTAEVYVDMILAVPSLRDAVLSYGNLSEAERRAGAEALSGHNGA